MADFSRVCLRNCGSGGVVDVPESQVINIFIIHVKQQLQYVLLQAEAGVQLIVHAEGYSAMLKRTW